MLEGDEDVKKEDENEHKKKYQPKLDHIGKTMEKDNVLNFIKDSQHSMIIMNKALGTQVAVRKSQMNPKKQAVMAETAALREYLQTYGPKYKKKYSSAHFSAPPG